MFGNLDLTFISDEFRISCGGIIFDQPPSQQALRSEGAEPKVLLVQVVKCEKWVLPKGGMEDGESWYESAAREVREETGVPCIIDMSRTKPIAVQIRPAPEFVTPPHTKLNLFFIGHRDLQQPEGDAEDGMKRGWFTFAEARNILSFERDVKVLDEAIMEYQRRYGPVGLLPQ
ncbi:hypothetical protein EV182_006484 [Spiromyces aspiralis]|uniref:Uncharacterized protein n=1 Tax=Spiromyces aspiralis TaxID=68401 RepID=A0ACC1HSG7_9FUNG|nr:hypothetical protein EV182_006484 [Spiromyces aspiralis]